MAAQKRRMQLFLGVQKQKTLPKGQGKGLKEKELQMKLDDAYYKGMDAGLGKSIKGNGKGKDEQVPPKGKGKGKAHSGKKGGAAETPAGKHNHAVIAWTCKVCGETHSNPTCSYCRECGCLRGQTWEEAQREHTLFLQKEVAAPSSTPAGSPPGPKDQAQQHPRPQGRAAKVRDGQLTFLDDILARPIEGEEVSESTVLMTEGPLFLLRFVCFLRFCFLDKPLVVLDNLFGRIAEQFHLGF